MTEHEVIATLNIDVIYIPEGRRNRPGGSFNKTSITIHETDNTDAGADAHGHSEFLNTNPEPVTPPATRSWHYTVDDKGVVKHLPIREMAYHAVKITANRNSIGIEICVNSDGDFDKAFDRAALLTAYLKTLMSLEVIKKHQDWTGKDCPQTILNDDRWEEFLQSVKNYEESFDFQMLP